MSGVRTTPLKRDCKYYAPFATSNETKNREKVALRSQRLHQSVYAYGDFSTSGIWLFVCLIKYARCQYREQSFLSKNINIYNGKRIQCTFLQTLHCYSLYWLLRCHGRFNGSKFQVPDNRIFNNNKWHRVTIEIGENLALKVGSGNREYRRRKLREFFGDLTQMNSYVYVGHAPNSITKTSNFTGCMKNVRVFRDSDLLFGALGAECHRRGFSPVRFKSPWSFHRFNVTNSVRHPRFFSVRFTFRTLQREGVVLSATTSSSKFRVRLNGGALGCEDVQEDRETPLPNLGSELGDGEWHSVHVSLDGTHKMLTVALDGKPITRRNYGPSDDFLNAQWLHISLGNDGQKQGFTGCLVDLQVNNESYSQRHSDSNGTQLGVCELKNPCSSNPCKNKGSCSVGWEENIICKCGIEYEGSMCEDQIYKTTCHMYMKQGLKGNASCSLATDDPNYQYTAECRVKGEDDMYTIIEPTDSMRNINVGAVNRTGLKIHDDFIVHTIVYNSENMERLKKSSKECQQMLHLDFFCGTSLPDKRAYWTGGDAVIKESSRITKELGSWTNGVRCANYTFFLEKSDIPEIPVTSLWFHRDYSSAYFTVGPLRCYGESGSSDDLHRKNAKQLAEVCTKISQPTPQPTLTTTERTAERTPSDPPDICDDSFRSRQGHCRTDPPKTGDRSPTDPERLNQKTEQVSDELSIGWTALLSCSLVVFFLVAIKFGLPRCVVYCQSHSRSGEYVVAATEGVVHKKTKNDLVNGRRRKGAPRDSPYWVWTEETFLSEQKRGNYWARR